MITIKLNNLLFFSHHGVHEEEKILGNNFEVNLELTLKETDKITTLEQTVNYATVYQIIKQKMSVPAMLLETLAQEIADKVTTLDERINFISVAITKLNPPITNIQGNISVIFKKDL